MYARALRTPLSAFSSVYAFAAVMLAAFPLPFVFFSPVLAYGAGFALAFGLCLAAAGAAFLFGARNITVPRTSWALIGFPLSAAVALSTVLSVATTVGWWGNGFETGTVGLYLLFALSVCAGTFVLRGALPALITTLIGFGAVTIGVAGSSYWLWPALFDSTAVSGAWPDLALISAAGFLAVVFGWKSSRSSVRKCAHVAAMAIFAAGLLLFYHPTLMLVLLCALLFSSLLLVAKAGHERAFSPALVAALFLVLAAVLFGPRSPFLPVPPEVRPSMQLTLLVASHSYSGSVMSVLFGAGPGSFAAVWEKGRPIELNQSAFSSAEFDVGHNVAVTFFILFGALGLAGLLFLMAGPIALAFRYAAAPLDGEGEEFAPVLLALSFFCFVALFFMTPGPSSLLVGGVLFGAAARALAGRELPLRIGSGMARGLIIALPLALCGAVLVWISGSQIAAAALHARGEALLVEGRTAEAAPVLEQSAALWGASQYQRDAARASLEAAFLELPQDAEQPLDPDVFEDLTRPARELSDASVTFELGNWRSWLACSSLYLSLYTAAGSTYAPAHLERAHVCLDQAGQHAPTRPDVPYAKARAAIVTGDEDAARAYLAEALRLKSDYAPALELQAVVGR